METYEIKGDLSEQRRSYLSVLLLVTTLLAIWVFSTVAARQKILIEPWICMFAALALSATCRYRKLTTQASWVYIAGLVGTFSIDLWQSGPHMTQALLMLIPVILASLLFDIRSTITLGAVSVGLMFGLSSVHAGLAAATSFTFMPALVCVTLLSVIYVNSRNNLNIVYWATDIQKKDSHRAEMFYEKSEQLSEALRQLTHANSRLELLNKQLEEAQARAERASNAKSVFLSNMSHELRTPLNVIIGYTSTILDMPGMYSNTALPGVYRNDVQLIKDNGYYLLGLINDILDLSKIEAGKLELHCTPVDLLDLLKGIVSTSIGLVKDKPIQIRPDFADNLPRVWADPMRVRQIILNLMSNAVKFTHTGSVTLRAAQSDGRIEISVIDTGIGIPDKALAHIFDRFQQAEHDTDKHYGGTGLGLDISRRLAIMHGGELTVRSEVGRGSIFAFTLPIHEDQVEQPEDLTDGALSVKPLAPAEAESSQIHTILLAEDEVSMRDMMRRTLEGVGHVVIDVQDGADVLDMVTGVLPDLIILDVRLPNVDGWEILQRLRQDAETAAIPVIVATVNEDEDRALQLGANLYLRKPFSSDELLADVQELLPHSLGTGEGN